MPTPAAQPLVTGLAQIAIFVKELDRAVAFYRDVLEIPFLFAGGPPEFPMAFFDCGGVRLLLGPAHKPEFNPPGSVLYLRTDDISATARALEARGVVFSQTPHRVAKLEECEVWLAEFEDPEGNALALMAEPRVASTA